MITYTNSINMYTGSIPLVIHVNQYDSDFTLVFNLYSSAGAFTVESGTTASIRGTKTDGNGYTANATIDISNRRVTVAGHVQMTATAGRNVYELVLTKSNKDIATANFILDCEPAAMDADTIQSETVLKELNAIIESAQTAEEAAERAEEAAEHLTIDTTLTQSGQAADAKVVGDELDDIKSDLNDMQDEIDSFEGISEEVKQALLACFRHIPFLDSNEQYYDDLYFALYGTLPKYINDFSDASLVLRKYYNVSGVAMDSVTDFIDETYYKIDGGKTYIWVQGFKGNNYIDNTLRAANCAYRVLFYDKDKTFLNRIINTGTSNDFGYIEPRFFTFTTPTNAEYIRVSASHLPMGIIVESIPSDLRLVTMVLANTNDATITSRIDMADRVSVFRSGVDITDSVIYGPGTEKMETDSDYESDHWRFAIFSVNNDDTSPEYGDNRESTTRIFNNKTFLAKSGDILHFENIKAAVRIENVLTGEVEHTSSWLVGTSSYTIN